jgi:AcrR family transcriptional regulator
MEATMAATEAGRREPLTRDRILGAALVLADEQGLVAVSMRRVGRALGVEAMSLYKHVADKEAILDGLVDLVMAEVAVPAPGGDWRVEIRRSAVSFRAALLRHPWAAAVFESRVHPGPARLRYLDATIATLLGAGFSIETTAQAFMALDSHTYGFVMQELAWPFDAAEAPELAATMTRELFGDYPGLRAMGELAAAGGTDPDFAFGLDLLLDGLERLREAS